MIRRLVPLFRRTEANVAANSLKVVRDALKTGGLEVYGIPRITSEHADSLTDEQKKVVGKCADDLTEYEFLLKHNMTSFSSYQYFSPFWASAGRFKVMNRSVAGFSSVAKLEGVPDLKALFGEIHEPFRRLPEIRNTCRPQKLSEHPQVPRNTRGVTHREWT